MTTRRPKLVVIGLSLSSSWGNGHATTYRALLRALAARGHDILFLERDVPWYASSRDLTSPDFCRLELYASVADLGRFDREIAAAECVLIGSYVPDGIEIARHVLRRAQGARVFYDIDTPVTLAAVDDGSCEYLTRDQIGEYDVYFSFTGGPTLDRLELAYGARQACALYCSVDPRCYRPLALPRRWDLGYLGTYSADRQPALERLLIEPARRAPHRRFVICGSQYPAWRDLPANVEVIPHLPPTDHAAFYCSLGWTLNLTRAAMVTAGWSPSVRLFEAAACGTPIISDRWDGLGCALQPESEIVVADSADDVLSALEDAPVRLASIAARARHRVLSDHTANVRAGEFIAALPGMSRASRPRVGPPPGAKQELTSG